MQRSHGERIYTYQRVSVIALDRNHGACIAINASIMRSTGEYIAVLNSDDVFLPEKVAKQVSYLKRNRHIAAAFVWPTFIDELGRSYSNDHKDSELAQARNRPWHSWLRHFFVNGNALCHPTVMIRKECYDAIGLYNPALAQIPDLEVWIRMLRRYDIHLLEEPLVGFRIRDGLMNASAARPEVIVRDQWEWQRVLEQYLRLDDQLLFEVFPELVRAQGPRGKVVSLRSWRGHCLV